MSSIPVRAAAPRTPGSSMIRFSMRRRRFKARVKARVSSLKFATGLVAAADRAAQDLAHLLLRLSDFPPISQSSSPIGLKRGLEAGNALPHS
ncbi:protein of unknown function [Methylocella tundrae]|uniref:Uncharacterized protein n=1 Tax=Methylocella tundrae TaxID=227605 RepID=A0A4U8Z285_METTU|nr:protein of unknown function [Methylocella tundrae]